MEWKVRKRHTRVGRPWMGHIYTPHQREKRGANRWQLLSIQHSISHLIACQPGLQSLRLPHYRPNRTTGHVKEVDEASRFLKSEAENLHKTSVEK